MTDTYGWETNTPDEADARFYLVGGGIAAMAAAAFMIRDGDVIGREIMTEVLGHLQFDSDSQAILKNAICIPCMMPFITSQFMPREEGDRPQVVPAGYKNLAFFGQYCELPNDVVFTVEYSIRTAQWAVSSLLGLKRKPPKVYKGATDPRVLFKAFKALHDMDA